MKRMRTLLVYTLLATIVVAVALFAAIQFGLLGPREVNISGFVTRDGKPLEWHSDAGKLSIVFLPKKRDTTTPAYRAESDRATGRFEVKNIPTGTYIVTVQQLDPDGAHDLLGMVYDPASTDIEREVTKDGEEFKIDIPKNLPKRRAAPPRMPPGPQAPRSRGETKKDEPKKDDSKKDESKKDEPEKKADSK
jgi:hypothetical protein